jgi:CRP-like cAMP-binding protein
VGTVNYNEGEHKKFVKKVGFNGDSPVTSDKMIKIKDSLRPSMPIKLEMVINEYLTSVNKDIPKNSNKTLAPKIVKKKKRTLESYNNVFDSESDEETLKIEENNMPGRFYIDPSSNFKTMWSLLIFFLVLYSVIVTPVIIAFSIDDYNILVIDTVIDCIFLVDTFLHFFIPFHGANTKFIYNPYEIIKHYLSTWFIFDLLTSLPIRLITHDSSGKNIEKLFRLTRLFRLGKWLKVARLMKLLQNNRMVEIVMNIEIISIIQINRVVKFIIILLMMVHISSCLWIYVGNVIDTGDTWIIANGLADAGNFDVYICSLYFIMLTILSIGYGDIVCRNVYERLFNLLFMLFGIMFFSFALSALASIFSKMDEKTIRLATKLNILSDIVKEYKIPRALRAKITKTVKHEINKTGYGKYEFMDSLPNQLKTELINVIHKKHMKNLFFFKDQNLDFIQFVLPMLKAIPFNQTEILFTEGNTLDEMYLIVSGSLNLTLGSYYGNMDIAVIHQNNHFGDILLYTGYQSPYNLITKTKYVEVLVLKKNDFMRLKKTFYSNILSLLSFSLNNMELYERRRMLISEIYKYETNHKVIQNILKNLNTYLLNKEDEGSANRKNLPELNAFLEKIGNIDFKSKFTEIADKLDSEFKTKDAEFSGEYGAESDTHFSGNNSYTKTKTLKKSSSKVSIDKHAQPYKALIDRILTINHIQSGMEDRRASTSTSPINYKDENIIQNYLDLQPLREEILKDFNKNPEDDSDGFKEVRKTLYKLSTLEIKRRKKKLRNKNFTLAGGPIRKMSHSPPRRLSRSPPRRISILQQKRSSKKSTHSRESFKLDKSEKNPDFIVLSNYENSPSFLKNRLETAKPSIKHLRLDTAGSRRNSLTIDLGDDRALKVAEDSKCININVYNYETKYNNNVILLGNNRQSSEALNINNFLHKSTKSVDILSGKTDDASVSRATHGGVAKQNDDIYAEIFQKLDGIFYVLDLKLRTKKKC